MKAPGGTAAKTAAGGAISAGIIGASALQKLKAAKKYGSGTENAEKGLNLVGENGIETFIDNDGNAALVTAPSLIPMEGGETVRNEQETRKLFQGLTNQTPFPLDENGSIILRTAADIFQEELKQLFPGFYNLVPHAQLPNPLPKYEDIVYAGKNDNVTVSVNDIHLHEAQNVDSFAKAILQELPGKVNQLLHKC